VNRPRVLYHMVRADFLERVRRYSFLLTLGFAIYLSYGVYSGQIVVQLDNYRGVTNSAWVGAVSGLVATFFLTLVGFYIVKNSIQRDRETRVGQILATTPISKSFYTFSKMLSNFAVLASMVIVLALGAILIQLMQSEDPHIHLAALLTPLLVIGLCALTVTSALAVLFETLPGLRGGIGNILYFFLWVFLLTAGAVRMESARTPNATTSFADYTGIAMVMGEMRSDLKSIDPTYNGGSSFRLGTLQDPPTQTFLWTGIKWTPSLILSRILWIEVACLLALLASLFFNRFDPAYEFSNFKRSRRKVESLDAPQFESAIVPHESQLTRPLTPLRRVRSRNRFVSLTLAELRLMLRGRAWWWHAVATGLFLGCLFSPLGAARSGIILAAWIWPALIWSEMGTREAQFSTGSLIFSAQRAFPRQLLATWMAGILVAILTGGGLGLHLFLARDFGGLGAWSAGAVFIPSLALLLGVLSGSRKPFEAIYTVWWYIGPAHHLPRLDFMGTTPQSATPLFYLGASGLFLIVALVWRKLRLASR
jgi:ABC-2 family transporter protein